MILKKQLRYLICVLQILHVLAENNSIELEGYDTTDNAARLLSLDFVEYTKTFEDNDAYVQSSTKIQDFSDETTEFDRNEHLLNDYLNSNGASMLASSSPDVPILDFDEELEPLFNLIDELNDRGITLPNDTENEQTMCNSTVPADPMLSIERYSASKNEILFSWKITKNESNCILNHLKTTCSYVATNGYGYDSVNGSATASINSSIHNEFLIINSTVEEISPYTTYSCSAYVTNEAGRSAYSDATNITTLEDIPSIPAFNVTNVTYSQFQIVWESPTYLPGSLQEFEITLEWEERFTVPDWCQSSSKKLTIPFNATTLCFNYAEAVAYTDYKVKIRAKTNAGWGNYSEYLTFQTLPKVSDAVSNFSLSLVNDENNPDRLDAILTWGFPCSPNGKVEYFNVSVYGIRSNRSPHSFSNRTYVPNNVTRNDIFVINLKELQAEYNYTIEVSVKVRDVQNLGIPVGCTVAYPAGIPFQPDEEYIKSITIDPSKARRSTTSATLLLPLFPDTNGDIIYYSIIVLKVDHNIASNTRYNFAKFTWPNISSWEESMLQDFTIPYQATRMYWDPYRSN